MGLEVTLSGEQVADLLVAALAVNSYPLAQARALLPALREQGLVDPAAVAALRNEEIVERLDRAGYRRGQVNFIVGPRLHELMQAIHQGALADLPALVSAGDDAAALQLLRTVPGVGPKVAAHAWQLLTTITRPGDIPRE